MKFFTTSNSKNIIATLRMVTIEKSELTFLLILYFHGQIIYQMKKGFNSNLQNTFSLKANFRCETAVRHIIKMEQFFGKLEHH